MQYPANMYSDFEYSVDVMSSRYRLLDWGTNQMWWSKTTLLLTLAMLDAWMWFHLGSLDFHSVT